MLHSLAVANYRSLLNLSLSLTRLNVVSGANGSGKSNLYRSLRLLADNASGGVVNSLALEGGLQSTLWAGPEEISRRMRSGEVPVQGTIRKNPVRLKLGFINDEFGYAISLGLPPPSHSAFSRDPEIKHEAIWAGSGYRPSSVLVERNSAFVKIRSGRSWKTINEAVPSFESILSFLNDPGSTPEIFCTREVIRSWRFYDHFRTDRDAPARQSQLGTRTPVLHHDGRDLAAALKTIQEIGDSEALCAAVQDAFPATSLQVQTLEEGRFQVALSQHGLLRPLSAVEMSDGTLRYLLWVAALLTPRPPELMVLNEPETSSHPDLLPALANLIINVANKTQLIVVSHSSKLIEALRNSVHFNLIELKKNLGETSVSPQTGLGDIVWNWPE